MWDEIQLLFVWAPVINIQLILEGIFIGAIFALSAYGLALVWGVMNIKNLAQGDFVILGGYLAFWLNMYGIPLVVILPIIMIVMFVYGWVVYLLVIRRILDQDMFVSLLATFGLSLLMQQAINLSLVLRFRPLIWSFPFLMPSTQWLPFLPLSYLHLALRRLSRCVS